MAEELQNDRRLVRVDLPLYMLRDTLFYLTAYRNEELTCIDPQLTPSKELCRTCPYLPCELVEVSEVIQKLATLLLKNRIKF